jgi:hypothetical protein
MTQTALIMAVLLVVAAAVAVRYALAHSPGSSKTLEDQWVLTVILLGFATYMLALWRTRVVVTDGAPTFVVKNPFRTHRIAWSDVDGFTERRVRIGGGPAGNNYVVKARLRNGRSIRCTGVGGIGTTPLRLRDALESLRVKETRAA